MVITTWKWFGGQRFGSLADDYNKVPGMEVIPAGDLLGFFLIQTELAGYYWLPS
jgi:hypothetical protein